MTHSQLTYSHIIGTFSQNRENVMIKHQIGLRIREIRQSKKMTQEMCALSIDMDRTYWASVELGKRNISIVNIKKICDCFGMSLKAFFDSNIFENKK